MSAYQRRKGHDWERDVARQLRPIFGEAHRGSRHCSQCARARELAEVRRSNMRKLAARYGGHSVCSVLGCAALRVRGQATCRDHLPRFEEVAA